GLEILVPDQALDGEQVATRFQQMRGVGMTQRVQTDGLAQAGPLRHPAHQPLHSTDAEVTVGAAAGKQPWPRPVATPVGPQLLQQPRRQGREAVRGAFALTQEHELPGGVDVFQAQGDQFADAQAQGIVGAEQGAVAVVGGGVEEARHLVRGEDGGELLGSLAVGDPVDNVRPAEGDGKEEAQTGGDLVEEAEGDPLLDQLELELADLLGGGLSGRQAGGAGGGGGGGGGGVGGG